MNQQTKPVKEDEIKAEATEHAKRVIALGWHKGRTEEVIAGAWEAGYIFGQIDAAAQKSEQLTPVQHCTCNNSFRAAHGLCYNCPFDKTEDAQNSYNSNPPQPL